MKKKKIFVKEFAPGDIVHHPFMGALNGMVVKPPSVFGNNKSVHVKAHGRYFTFSPAHLTMIERHEDRKTRVVESVVFKKHSKILTDSDIKQILSQLDPTATQEDFDKKLSALIM